MYKVKYKSEKNKNGSIKLAGSGWIIEREDKSIVNQLIFPNKAEAEEHLERLKALGYTK